MNFKQRISSNRADANSTSQIIWIALAAVVALTVGGVIFRAVTSKGTEVGGQIGGISAQSLGRTSSTGPGG